MLNQFSRTQLLLGPEAMEKLKNSRVAVFGFMNPVFGVILSAWLLREGAQALGPVSLVSLVLVCTGIYIVNSRERSEKD